MTKAKKLNTKKLFGVVVGFSGLIGITLIAFFLILPVLGPGAGEKPVLSVYDNSGVSINGDPVNTKFTDRSFYACVLDNLNNAKINDKSNREYTWNATPDELLQLTNLDCYSNIDQTRADIANFDGLSEILNLTSLTTYYNNASSIDVSQNTKLTKLTIGVSDKLVNLVGLEKLTSLTNLRLYNNEKLDKVNVSNNIELTSLEISSVQDTIDVSKNTKLTKLIIQNSPNLTTLIGLNKLSALTSLKLFVCPKLSEFDISNIPELISLEVYKIDASTFDVSHNIKLTSLSVGYNPNLVSIDGLDKLASLNSLELYVNLKLNEIDISQNRELTKLTLKSRNDSTIDVSVYTKLDYLQLSDNAELTNLAGLDKLTALRSLILYNNAKLLTVNASKNLDLTKLQLGGTTKLSGATLSDYKLLESLSIADSDYKTLDLTTHRALKGLFIYRNNALNNLIVDSRSPFDLSTQIKSNQLLQRITIKDTNGDVVYFPIKSIALIKPGYPIDKLNKKLIVSMQMGESSSPSANSANVLSSSGKELASNGIIKTGDIIRGAYNTNTPHTVKLAALGDVVPDGQVTFSDVIKLFQHYKKIAVMKDEAEIAAGDTVADDNINFSDVIKLFQYYKKIIKEL